jgi:RHS repeat-associated protein
MNNLYHFVSNDGIPEQLAISGGRALIDMNGSARTYEYQYFITDHQGNTRLTFTTAPKSLEFPATFESENAANEEGMYSYIAEVRVPSTAADANSDGGNEVVRLNTAHAAAAAINIPVTVGDKLDMEVYAYYESGSDYSTTKGLLTFVRAVAGAFGGVNGGTPGEQAIYDRYYAAYNGGAAAMMGTTNSSVPAAYLNYILFDENGVSYQHGYVQISSNADGAHEKLDLTNILVTKNGIISVYLTNESIEGHVYFDDMKVTLHETNIVQENAYYPFGLPLDDNPFFYTFVPNRFLYQGKEWQTALALNLYDFHARQYDPALGRWWAMDPAGQFSSPYNGMGNNPVIMVDPDGEFVFTAILGPLGVVIDAALWGAVFNGGIYSASTVITGQAWDWGQFGSSVAKGAVAGAISGGVGLGVSSGLTSLGASSGTANFIGGFAGNFAAGSYANGGIPTNPAQLALLAGSSALSGAFYSNPLSSAKPSGGSPESGGVPNFGSDVIVLPPVQIKDLRLGNYPPWWGMTNLFMNPITRSTSLSGFYNGSYDRFVNFFSDNQTELRWRQGFDGEYYPYEHVNYVGGTAPVGGGGGIGNIGKGYQYTKSIGSKYHQYTKIVKAGKLSGQARAEYTKIFNNKGKLIRMFKDSYKIDGRFYHRAPYHPRILGQSRYIR